MSTNAGQTRSVTETFDEGLRYFMGQGNLNTALAQLGADLDRHHIDYVVIGAVALLAYGYPRFTEDIDIVMTPAALGHFQRELVGLGYKPAFSGAKKTFRSSSSLTSKRDYSRDSYLQEIGVGRISGQFRCSGMDRRSGIQRSGF